MHHHIYEHAIPQNLYEMLNDSSIDRVMAIDNQWCVIAWNNTAAQITGIDKDVIIGKPLFDVFPQLQQDKELVEAIQFAMQGKKTFVPAKAGLLNRHSYENHFIPLKVDDGQVKGVMNIMHDVAHQEKAEKKLQQLNETLEHQYHQLEMAATEMAAFTYITSNEITEPLRHVYTAFELLVKSEGKVLSNGGKANIRRIQASLNRINLLLNDIWSLSHISTFKQVRARVNLNEVFLHARDKLQNIIADTSAVVTANQMPVIQGYGDMLETLFVNLIGNSLKFQQPGAQPVIHITCEGVQPAALPAVVLNRMPMAFIKFTDNGIGFDQINAERIFGMFEKLHPRNQYHGSGMGLTIVKKIVEAHDGFVQATAQAEKGTIIECYLPVGEE